MAVNLSYNGQVEFEPIRLTYAVDTKLLSDDYRRSRYRALWPLLAAALIAIAYLVVSALLEPEMFVVLIALVVALGLVLTYKRWRWRAAVRDPANVKAYGERTITINADAVQVQYPDGTTSNIMMRSFVGWDETPHFLFLYIASAHPYPIPKAGLDEQEQNRLRDLVENRLALKRRRYGTAV